jgi:hypothetical protein
MVLEEVLEVLQRELDDMDMTHKDIIDYEFRINIADGDKEGLLDSVSIEINPNDMIIYVEMGIY